MSSISDFTLPNQDGEDISWSNYRGKYVVLYFYPRDNTPGCTTEAVGFTTLKEEFSQLNCEVVGVSKDSVKKHRNFCDKKELTITLLSDEEGILLEDIGVWQQKKMAGREYMGIVRTTLLIDPEGEVVKQWDKVKVKGHVEEVFSTLKEIQ